jgi:putative ABC transport system substrate-binding protein
LTIDQRDAGGQVEWLGGLAVELGLLKPDAIVAIGFVAAGAVREVIKAIPIIFVSNDSIEQGFVDSLARPGGMMTGIELMGDDLSAKWLEFLKEVLPSLDRVGLLEALPAREGRKQALLAAAGSLGKKIVLKQVGRPDELPGAVEAIAAAGTQGMIVLPSALFHGAQKQVVGLAARHRLPAIYEHRDFVEAGGLMSYGPDIGTMFRRLADYIDRIVKGASPATMPVERPIKFELVVNLKTATSLGITVPESLLARADEVIE